MNLVEKKKARAAKRKVVFVLFALIMLTQVTPIFAASSDGITELDTWANKLLSLFSSTWLKVACLIALAVEAIALIFAGQNGGGGQMLKKFAPWVIGTVILLASSSITSYFLGSLELSIS